MNYTIKTIGYVIAGAGIDRLSGNLQVGIVLVLLGVALEVLVALLQKYNVPIESVNITDAKSSGTTKNI